MDRRTEHDQLKIMVNRALSSDIPEEAWAEMTDPMSFVVGSVLILFRKPKRGAPVTSSPSVKLVVAWWRLVPTLEVAVVVALPVLVGLLFPHLGTGDASWYGITLLIAGAFTFVPGRVAELRRKGRVRGFGYPKKLRKAMWNFEWLIALIATLVIVVWGFGGPENHSVVRAVVWGLLAMSASEIFTFSAVQKAAIAEEAARTLQEESLPATAEVEAVPVNGPKIGDAGSQV